MQVQTLPRELRPHTPNLSINPSTHILNHTTRHREPTLKPLPHKPTQPTKPSTEEATPATSSSCTTLKSEPYPDNSSARPPRLTTTRSSNNTVTVRAPSGRNDHTPT